MTNVKDERRARDVPLVELLVEDLETYDRRLTEPGLWAVIVHRLGERVATLSSPRAESLLRAGCRAAARAVDLVWGIRMAETLELGRRVRIWHSGCVDLQARAIGDDVHIRHDTTLGGLYARDTCPSQWPVIEDRAELGSGVSVLGDVRVGREAFVGANTLVLKNVAPRSMVLGVPARVVPA